MIDGKTLAVVLPAYNAAATLKATVDELPSIVDHRILVDDGSKDDTVAVARQLGLTTFVHDGNYGYGRNQMTCYREALRAGADIVVMVHPDYQYTPRLVTAMASMIAYDVYDVVLGSKLSEYHTGYRAFGRRVLETLPLLENSDDFVFDNQMLTQCLYFGFRVGEVSCPTKYFPEASSIGFGRSVTYGVGVLRTAMQCALQRRGIRNYAMFDPNGRRLETAVLR